MTINYKIKYAKAPIQGEFETNTLGCGCTTNQLRKLMRQWLEKTIKKFNIMLVGETYITCTVPGWLPSSLKGIGLSAIDPDTKLTFGQGLGATEVVTHERERI